LAIVWAINKFKDFLWGEEFTVITDNNALTQLKSLHQKSKKLTRWAQKINEWECKIIHCPGRKNVVADPLSRAPVDPVPNEPDHLAGDRDIFIPLLSLTYYDNLLSSIRDAQKEDVPDIVKKLENQRVATVDCSKGLDMFIMKDRILCRVILPFKSEAGPSRSDVGGPDYNRAQQAFVPVNNIIDPVRRYVGGQNNSEAGPSKHDVGGPERFEKPCRKLLVPVLPKSLVIEVLQQFHDAPESGHMGSKKTKNAIKQSFFLAKYE